MRTSIILCLTGVFLFSCQSEKSQQETTAPSAKEASLLATVSNPNSIMLAPSLESYLGEIAKETASIPADRQKELKKLALYIKTKKNTGEDANLVFICTHNSRRSHMSQLWAITSATYLGVDKGIFTYSGGTEVTAFNPRAVAAMERAGFIFEKEDGENPRYIARFADQGPAFPCWSKKYDDPANPQENFAAIMTCSEADKNCPFIPGASLRSPIKYEDPKEFDGTSEEQKAYDERCRQIATEMYYLMSQVKA